MQAIHIDFCRTRRTPRWAAPVLMLLAFALVGDVGVSFLQLHREVKRKEVALAKADPRSYRPARSASAEEVAAAKDTLSRLSMPWDKLFVALEGAATDQVALLSIEPDPKAGTVLISGDGKDYLAALTYVLNLSRSESLGRVQLARHEQKKDQGNAVGFAVSATWAPLRAGSPR